MWGLLWWSHCVSIRILLQVLRQIWSKLYETLARSVDICQVHVYSGPDLLWPEWAVRKLILMFGLVYMYLLISASHNKTALTRGDWQILDILASLQL